MAELGRLLGEGRTAEVHEYGESHVVKLLRTGFAERLLDEEAEATAMAAEAGAPAPTVHGRVWLRGRPGAILGRVDGVSLLDLILERPNRWRDWAKLLAQTHARILTLAAPGYADLREALHARISSITMLPEKQRASILAILDSLEGGDALLHGDFHPGNVFVSGDGEPAVIDWGDSSRGQAAADVARTLHLVSPETIPPGLARRDEVMRGAGPFRDVYLQTVLELVGIDEEDVGRWMLPVLAARLDEDIAWERKSILRKIESSI